MASYAVLGATGRVGSCILDLLLQNDQNSLNLYVRSKKKILAANSSLKANSNVHIFEGDIQDVEVIKDCISDTKAVFLAVALSENLPGCSIAMDTARVVVEALKELRAQNAQFRAPKLIILSSSSVDDKWWEGIPRFVHSILFKANYNIYVDLQKAERFLREEETWLPMTFLKPGGLSEDVQRGYKLDTTKMHTPMSFADLAAAMIEIADTPDERWDAKDVSIVPKTVGARIEFKLPYVLGKGLLAYYLPSVYMYLRAWMP